MAYCESEIAFPLTVNVGVFLISLPQGEPADNVDAVIKATEILTTNECFQLSTSKVTVSTVAPTPDSFRQFANAPCVLAWSVHGASDEMRRQLVPTTKYKMSELRQGLIDTLLQRPLSFRAVMLEVVLIDQVNDGLEQAEELAQFVRVIVDAVPGIKLMINLIPFNDIGHQTYRRPSADNVAAFQKHLWDNGLHAHVRVTRGDDESAACGQLSTLRQQKKLL
jgi:23S rRNA (adenine2503-C2)-methyltransferase